MGLRTVITNSRNGMRMRRSEPVIGSLHYKKNYVHFMTFLVLPIFLFFALNSFLIINMGQKQSKTNDDSNDSRSNRYGEIKLAKS